MMVWYPEVGLGDTVFYRSKIDNGPGNDVLSPALVIRTRASNVPAVVDRWADAPMEVHAHDGTVHTTAPRPEGFVAELPDNDTVDLVVFGLGKTYREYAVSRGSRRGQWDYR